MQAQKGLSSEQSKVGSSSCLNLTQTQEHTIKHQQMGFNKCNKSKEGERKPPESR